MTYKGKFPILRLTKRDFLSPEILVEIPKHLNARQKQLLQELAKESDETTSPEPLRIRDIRR